MPQKRRSVLHRWTAAPVRQERNQKSALRERGSGKYLSQAVGCAGSRVAAAHGLRPAAPCARWQLRGPSGGTDGNLRCRVGGKNLVDPALLVGAQRFGTDLLGQEPHVAVPRILIAHHMSPRNRVEHLLDAHR